MSSPVFLTIGIIGGVMVLGGLTYIAIGRSKILESDKEYEKYRKRYYEGEEYKKNLRARSNYLRSKSIRNITQRRPTKRIYDSPSGGNK